jgi:type I restriction enzyme S subunit
MGSEWPQVPLQEVANVLTGFPFKGEAYLPPKSGIRVVRGDNVTEGRIRWGEKEKCWPAVTPELKPYVLQTDDLVIGMDGSRVGRNFATISPEDEGTLLAQRVARLRAKGPVHQRYLKYSICNPSFTNYVKSIHTGTSIPHISKGQIQRFEIYLPPLDEQVAIANVLGALDDRIDHNRAFAAKLEAIARRLFKSWFVDFDPVRAKAAGEKPHGLADDIASLFPDRFLDSELGEIPEGWRLETLASVARLNPEAWTTRKHPDEIHYLDLSNVKDGMVEAPTRYSWEEAPSRARRVLQQGDTIIGTVRPGNRSFALIDQAGLTGSTGFAVLRPASDINREFLYLASTSDDAIERLAHLADGAAYPAVRPEIVLATEAIIPGEEIMKAFSSVTKGMIDRASVCKQEANALAGIRDLLLPRLISGKLRVEDAEFVIEEAIA